MDGVPSGAEDGSVRWFYLDSVGKEFGPFPNEMMREWYSQGFFPLGEQLQIRLPAWNSFALLKHVYPDVSEAFVGLPRTGPPVQAQPPPHPAPSPPPMEPPYSSGFDTPQFQLPSPDGFLGRRPVDDMPPPFPPQQMGAYWMMGGNGAPSPSAEAGPGMGGPMPGGMQNNLLGVGSMPMHGGGLPGGGCLPGRAPEMQQNMGMGGCMGIGGQAGNMPSRLLGQVQSPSPSPILDGACARGGADGGFQNQGGFTGMPPQQQPAPGGMSFSLQRYRGKIKSFNKQHGFGFIENADAFAHFGRDVFLHKAQIGNLKVGTEVTYGVEMNKQGMPQARDLFTVDGLPPGPAPFVVAKGGTKKAKGKGKGSSKGEQIPQDAGKVGGKGKKGAGKNGKGGNGKPFILPTTEHSTPIPLGLQLPAPTHSEGAR